KLRFVPEIVELRRVKLSLCTRNQGMYITKTERRLKRADGRQISVKLTPMYRLNNDVHSLETVQLVPPSHQAPRRRGGDTRLSETNRTFQTEAQRSCIINRST